MQIGVHMENTQKIIDDIVKNNSLVLFMKGSFHFPQCGFSARAIAVLKQVGIDEKHVKTINVLENEEIRQGIKAYSNWPTIPQLYLNGEFIGGSDILIEMFETGELQNLIQNA